MYRVITKIKHCMRRNKSKYKIKNDNQIRQPAFQHFVSCNYNIKNKLTTKTDMP